MGHSRKPLQNMSTAEVSRDVNNWDKVLNESLKVVINWKISLVTKIVSEFYFSTVQTPGIFWALCAFPEFNSFHESFIKFYTNYGC